MNEENLFLEIEISEWNDFFKIDESFIKNYIFRGQSDKNWILSSSLERLLNRLHPDFIDNYLVPSQENEMLNEFKWKSKLFNINSIDESNNIEWLSLMQHYGAATRLIDFTDSFYISLFMAVFESSTDATIWCINKNVISNKTFQYYRENIEKSNSISQKELNEYSLSLANHFIKNSFSTEENRILLIRPQQINERLYRQQGLFIMPTNIKIPFTENLTSFIYNKNSINLTFEDFLDFSKKAKQNTISMLKFNISKDLYRTIIIKLKEMNINSESLFPGIEGLAKSLNYSKFNS